MSTTSAAIAHIHDDMNEISSTYAFDADCASASGLPTIVLKIAELFDGTRSLADVAAKARISESKCERVVRKLTVLGVLVEAPREMSKTLESHDGFTRLEHDFFNSDVAPIDECDEEVVSVGDRFRANLAEFMARFRSEKAIG